MHDTKENMGVNSANRRVHKRRSVLLKGKFYWGKDFESCIISNVSVSGARLRFDRPLTTEPVGALHCDRFGMMPGSVAWQGGNTIGFRFLAGPDKVQEILENCFPRTAFVLGMT